MKMQTQTYSLTHDFFLSLLKIWYFEERITKQMISPKKPIIQPIKGYNIEGSIDGLSVNVIEADWCNVLHQSTDFLIMGIFTKPTMTNHDNNLSAFS